MAKLITNNILLSGIRGSIGGLTIRQTANGPVASLKRGPNRNTWPGQQKQIDKFKRAAAYASAINRDPKKRKEYEAKLKRGESVYQKAMKEYLRRPEADE